MMRHWRPLSGITLFLLALSAGRAQAWVGYPYYGPFALYQPVDPFPTRGAALGPWAWSFNFGGGPTAVIGSHGDLTNGWNFTVGGGYNFTPRSGLVFEFMDNGFGVTDASMQNNQAVDGNAGLWAITLNPIRRFRIGGPVGGYLIGGGGFYERSETFTQAVTFFVPTPDGGGFNENGFQDIRQLEDTGGVNAGLGLTCNLGWGTKLFVEARYHHLFTAGGGRDFVPVTFGLRW